MTRFMALYMELRRDRFVEEFTGRVDGHERRCTRLCARPERTERMLYHRHSDTWHVRGRTLGMKAFITDVVDDFNCLWLVF